jgi:hypothetical protein
MNNMAIKTNVEYEKDWDFPRLYVHRSSGVIVYMTGVGNGTVVGKGSLANPDGTCGSHWNMENLEPFCGKITLENK